MPDDLLTIAEAAKLAGISEVSIIKAMDRGTLPYVQIFVKVRRLRPAAVLAHVERTGRKPGRPKA